MSLGGLHGASGNLFEVKRLCFNRQDMTKKYKSMRQLVVAAEYFLGCHGGVIALLWARHIEPAIV